MILLVDGFLIILTVVRYYFHVYLLICFRFHRTAYFMKNDTYKLFGFYYVIWEHLVILLTKSYLQWISLCCIACSYNRKNIKFHWVVYIFFHFLQHSIDLCRTRFHASFSLVLNFTYIIIIVTGFHISKYNDVWLFWVGVCLIFFLILKYFVILWLLKCFVS